MPDARELKAARRAAARTMEELSSSLDGAARAALPALLRRCFQLLCYLDAYDRHLAIRCRLDLLDSMRGALSREPYPSLLPAIEVLVGSLVSRYVSYPIEQRTVLEFACSHFISSLEDEGGFRAFLSAISWTGNQAQGAPEIHSSEAFALLNIARSFSLPGVVEAHLLLLTSRCFSFSGPYLDTHLSAFQHFMNLYVSCLPALGVFNRTGGINVTLGVYNRTGGVKDLAWKKPLTCCINEVTHQRLENRVNDLLSFCQAHGGDNLPISYSEIYRASARFIEENQHMLHERFRQEATTVVRSIVSKALRSAKQKEVHDYGAEITQDVICHAAALRLMGSLVEQILHHFSQMGAAGDKESAKHVALSRNFRIFCDTICLLRHYDANEFHRCDFIGTIGEPAVRGRASIQMLAHFASLSVFSVTGRLGFLWRVCIIMMMMAMNLLILEEESMDTLQLLIDASKESADIIDNDDGNLTSRIPTTENGNLQMEVYAQRSSKAIALQLSALRNRSTEKVDGRAFLQSHPDYKPSWNDLDGFFECIEGKDYSECVDQIKKYKTFKIERFISKRKRNHQHEENPTFW